MLRRVSDGDYYYYQIWPRNSYLVNAGTALGDEPNNDRLFAARNETKAHGRVSFQDDAAWLWSWFVVAVVVRQFVRGRLVQVTGVSERGQILELFDMGQDQIIQ